MEDVDVLWFRGMLTVWISAEVIELASVRSFLKYELTGDAT